MINIPLFQCVPKAKLFSVMNCSACWVRDREKHKDPLTKGNQLQQIDVKAYAMRWEQSQNRKRRRIENRKNRTYGPNKDRANKRHCEILQKKWQNRVKKEEEEKTEKEMKWLNTRYTYRFEQSFCCDVLGLVWLAAVVAVSVVLLLLPFSSLWCTKFVCSTLLQPYYMNG